MLLQVLLENPVQFFRIVAIVILSITLHELTHGYTALWQGDDTPRRTGHLTLNPVIHMGWESIILLCMAGIAWGQMPVNPRKFRSPQWGNVLVSAAGPLLNLALALLSILVLKLTHTSNISTIFSVQFFQLAAYINLQLFLFNLLPIPPLDGFHVFSRFFPVLKPLEEGPFGLFAITILFITPGFSQGLAEVIYSLIGLLSGVVNSH